MMSVAFPGREFNLVATKNHARHQPHMLHLSPNNQPRDE